MPTENLQELKAKFIRLMKRAAGKRQGYAAFMVWLETTDFFTAPAGTRHHGAVEGGLLRHTMNAYRRPAGRKNEAAAKGVGKDSLTVAALLHDVCKADCCRKKEDGWGYVCNKGLDLPVGHGERSVILVQQHMPLSPEEIVAIRCHMGGWDNVSRFE